jgi:hypothetical protein
LKIRFEHFADFDSHYMGLSKINDYFKGTHCTAKLILEEKESAGTQVVI